MSEAAGKPTAKGNGDAARRHRIASLRLHREVAPPYAYARNGPTRP
jgi:hypothetical protein